VIARTTGARSSPKLEIAIQSEVISLQACCCTGAARHRPTEARRIS
jgi:hypothetical protein